MYIVQLANYLTSITIFLYLMPRHDLCALLNAELAKHKQVDKYSRGDIPVQWSARLPSWHVTRSLVVP